MRRNLVGLDLHARSRWEQAASMFLSAAEADPSFALAHYNAAAAMARAIAAHDEPCESYEKYSIGDVARELSASIRLDARRRARLADDNDFYFFRNTVWLRVLRGADPSTKAGLTALLPKIAWRGAPITSDTVVPPTIHFHDHGVAELEADVFPDDGAKVRRTMRATWRVVATVDALDAALLAAADAHMRRSSGAAPGSDAVPTAAKRRMAIEVNVQAAHGEPASQHRGVMLGDGRIFFRDDWWLDDSPFDVCFC